MFNRNRIKESIPLVLLLSVFSSYAFHAEVVGSCATNCSLAFDASRSMYYSACVTDNLLSNRWQVIGMMKGADQMLVYSNLPIQASGPTFCRIGARHLSGPADYDGDGYNDVEELDQNTDPTNAINASRLVAGYDFSQAYLNGSALYASNKYYIGYLTKAVSNVYFGATNGADGSAALCCELPAGTSVLYYIQMLTTGHQQQMPQPSNTFYRVSFDAKADRNQAYLRVFWCDNSYCSRRTTGGGAIVSEHQYQFGPVLLSTNWETYSCDLFFPRDDFFAYWNGTNSQSWNFRLEPDSAMNVSIDNLTMEQIYPSWAPVPDIVNRGFERGAYGWTDRTMWSYCGLPKESETNYAHWEITEETAHSGRRCAKVNRKAMENARTIPVLNGAIENLQEGRNYVISYWAKTSGNIGSLTWTCLDCPWSGYLRMSNLGNTSAWTRCAVLLHRYGDLKTSTIKGLVNGGPQGNRAAMLSLSPQVTSWSATLYVDDIQLDCVDEALASAITNAIANGQNPCQLSGFPASRYPVDEEAEGYLITTDYSSLSETRDFAPGYHHLFPTNLPAVPVSIEKNTNVPGLPDTVDVELSLQDYTGASIYAVTQQITLVGNAYNGLITVDGWAENGRLPEGMYGYTLKQIGTGNNGAAARDRIFVADFTNQFSAGSSNLFFGLDQRGMTLGQKDTLSGEIYVARETLDYDVEVNLPLFQKLGAGYVRLWVLGRYPEEFHWLTNAVTRLRQAGMEPLVCINGYVGAESNTCYSLNDVATYDASWNQADWTNYIRQLAMLCGTGTACYVQHWEVLNEPYRYDNRFEAYTNLLETTWHTIKGLDSNAIIHAFTQILDNDTLKMIEACAAHGALDYVDVIDYHAYYPKECDPTYLEKLKYIIRTYKDGNTEPFAEGERYLPCSIPIWQSEYTPDQPLIAVENRVLDEERGQAATLMQKIITAKAFNVEKFFLYAVSPAQSMGFLATPVHRFASSPMFNLNYAVARTAGIWLNDVQLKQVFHASDVIAYLFQRSSGEEVLAVWSTLQRGESVRGGWPVGVRGIRMDGSPWSIESGQCVITGEPVFLEADQALTPLEWDTWLGNCTVEVVEP